MHAKPTARVRALLHVFVTAPKARLSLLPATSDVAPLFAESSPDEAALATRNCAHAAKVGSSASLSVPRSGAHADNGDGAATAAAAAPSVVADDAAALGVEGESGEVGECTDRGPSGSAA